MGSKRGAIATFGLLRLLALLGNKGVKAKFESNGHVDVVAIGYYARKYERKSQAED
jgi:hypothetical protein